MRLQNNTISNNHHNLIFLDVDGVINATFSRDSSEKNTKPTTYYNDNIGQELATFFLVNKEDLDSFVVYDDINGDVARLFPNNYLLVDTLVDFDDELCKKVKDIITE